MRRPPDALAERLYGVLTRALRVLRTSSPSARMTLERLNTLRLIRTVEPVSVAELAQIERVHASTMSRMISSLTREGFVRRTAHQSDGRGTLLRLTAKGKAAERQALEVRLEELAGALDGLSAKDRATLERALSLLDSVVPPDSRSTA